MSSNNHTATVAERELIIERLIDAPREVVYKAWAEREHLERWWGPKGFLATYTDLDVRPGGVVRMCMRSPGGVEHCNQGVYREVVEPERLVFTFAWEEPDGVPGREMLITLEFGEEAGKTRFRFHQAAFVSIADRDGHSEGWSESLDDLEGYLAEATRRVS